MRADTSIILDELLQATVDHPQDEDLYSVLADWLEEHDDPRRAELVRLHRRLLATCWVPDRHHDWTACQACIVELLAQGVRPCVLPKTLYLAEPVELTFSFIPP